MDGEPIFSFPAVLYFSEVLLLNKRIQTQNRVAEGFPNFVREGFDVKVIAPGFSVTPEG